MLHCHANPWILVFFGDLTGCCLLTSFDLTKTAVAIYVLATAIEGRLLILKRVPPEWLVWISDLVPTLILAALLISVFRIVLQGQLDQQNSA
jgi:hypothetical protein